MLNNIKTFAKFIDQPILVAKFNKSMPKVMSATGAIYWGADTYETVTKSENKKKALNLSVKKGLVIGMTMASAVSAPKIASRVTKRPQLQTLKDIRNCNRQLIDEFLKNNSVEEKTAEILKKAKDEPVSFKNLKFLMSEAKISEEKRGFLNKLIPNPENISSKDIFSEIGYLSVYGAVPVVGGVTGGITADILMRDDFKKRIPDKINEGMYQYLANIFLCNVGAGAALYGMEKANVHSKWARAIGMTAGIILTGVVGGSKIANAIANNVICPMMRTKEKTHRTPEALDIGLHADDIATVSLLSGLKWIEPALPLLYSISGYRAGMGYRN